MVIWRGDIVMANFKQDSLQRWMVTVVAILMKIRASLNEPINEDGCTQQFFFLLYRPSVHKL